MTFSGVDEGRGPQGRVTAGDALPGALAESAAGQPDGVAMSGTAVEAEQVTGWDEVDDLPLDDYLALMDDVGVALAEMHGVRGLPNEELVAGLDDARRALGRSSLGSEDAVTILDDELEGSIESVGRLHTQLGALGFTLAKEAAGRGLHQSVAMSLVDWLRVRCPWLSTQEAAQITAVVKVSSSPTGAMIGDAVAHGTVPLHRAALVARTMTRLEGSLDPDQRESYAQIATAAAARQDLSDRDLAKVCHRLLEDLLHETKPGEREQTAIEQRSMTQRPVGPGLTRFTIDAPDGAAAVISGVLTSQLAAPAPVEEEPDTRLPAQRRFDAFMTVVGRGVSNPDAPPSTARATVLLTIPFDAERGRPCGPATTADGGYVAPRQAGELACSGDLTPVWLTADGEPLALGRTARFASPAQWKALAVRDGGCSFPGCSAPPQWCDSHHLDWWSRGGRTDVDRMTLLCGRHHTHVHQHDLQAAVTGGVVTWHV